MKIHYMMLTAVLFMTGCSTPYKPDLVGKPTATLKMLTDFSGSTAAWYAKDCKGSALELIAKFDTNTYSIVRGNKVADIPADSTFRLMYAGSGWYWDHGPRRNISCSLGVEFMPEEGARYDASFELSGGKCFVSLNERVEQENGVDKYFPVQMRKLPTCTDGQSSETQVNSDSTKLIF